MAVKDAAKGDIWRYCTICRQNHEEGRKHIFTKKHLSKLKTVISKFSRKVRSARKCLAHPVVLDGELEPGAKMWCYCCEEELPKHVTDGSVSVEWGGLIEHLVKPEHHKKARHFWWENGVETKQLQMYLLFPAEYTRYKERVSKALQVLEVDREEKVKKLAENLREREQLQALTALEPPESTPTPAVQSIGRSHRPARHATDSGQHVQRHVTTQRQQSGHSSFSLSVGSSPTLSRVTPQPSTTKSRRGNVHTGATPPWLRDDEDEDSLRPIGPSVDEFIKHREQLKRSGRNPKRVGADFHLKLALNRRRGEEDDDDWLPSFGRVWNPGPRSHTKSEFRREIEQKNKKLKIHHNETQPSVSFHQGPSTSYQAQRTSIGGSTSTHPTSSQTLLPGSFRPITDIATNPSDTTVTSRLPTIKPYVRKRGLGQPSDITTKQDNTISMQRVDDTEHLGRVITPYKRQRVISKTSPSGSTSWLETGLESMRSKKHSPEVSLDDCCTNTIDNSTVSMDAQHSGLPLCAVQNDSLLSRGTVRPNVLEKGVQ